MRSRNPALLAIVFVVALSATALAQQLPTTQLTSIYPPGGKQGTSVEVTIAGGDLDDALQLLFSHPGITASPKMSEATEFMPARPVENRFVVSIAGDVPVGNYEARVVGRYGVSNPRTFAVGTLEEFLDDGSNRSFASAKDVNVGTVVSGRVDGNSVDYYKLTLNEEQRVIIECAAQRIDSRMNATIVVFDSTGRELASSRDVAGTDAVVNFKAPAAGPYIVAVYDFVYGGGGEYFYRLGIHSRPFIDFVFPPSGTPGATTQFTLYGRNLPGGQPADGITLDGAPLEKVTVGIPLPGDEMSKQQPPSQTLILPREATLDGIDYRLDSPQGGSNPVAIHFARAPLVMEQEPNDLPANAQQVTLPCEFVGQFFPARDRDCVQFDAKKGDVYWIEVISHRLGWDSDPYFMLQKITKKDNGEENVSDITQVDDPNDRQNRIGSDFDTSTDDPAFRFVVPDDATYRVIVRDQFGTSTSDPRRTYRLLLRPAEPDFRLVALPTPAIVAGNNNVVGLSAPVVRRGGSELIEVTADRRDGFQGEIEISVEGLPGGVTCPTAVIGGDVDRATLVVSAEENAAAWAGAIRIAGKAKVGDREVVRYARGGSIVWGTNNRQQQPPDYRATRDIALAVTDTETMFAQVQVGDGNLIETSLGGKLEVPVQIVRRDGFNAGFKLTATGLPNDFKPKEINIGNDGKDAKLEIEITNNKIQPGAYTFCLKGDAKMKYGRNQDAVTRAQDEQKRLDAMVKEMMEQAKQANDAKTAAVKAAQDAANQLKPAEQAKNAAQNELNSVQGDAKQAATEKLTAAESVLANAQAAAKSADEAKAAAERAATESDQKVKTAQALKQQADKDLGEVTKVNQAKDYNFTLVSTPIKLRVVASPITLSIQTPGGTLKPGEKVEIPVSVDRRYGFEDQVDITLELPGGVGGLTVNKFSIAKDSRDGKFEISASDKATPGEHTVTVRAKLKFNNVNIDTTEQFVLKVEQAQPPAN